MKTPTLSETQFLVEGEFALFDCAPREDSSCDFYELAHRFERKLTEAAIAGHELYKLSQPGDIGEFVGKIKGDLYLLLEDARRKLW